MEENKEQLLSVYSNLKTFSKQNPAVMTHPSFVMAMNILKAVINDDSLLEML